MRNTLSRSSERRMSMSTDEDALLAHMGIRNVVRDSAERHVSFAKRELKRLVGGEGSAMTFDQIEDSLHFRAKSSFTSAI